MNDFYQTLEVQTSATDAEIKSAYRRLAKIYHPDHNRGNQVAEAKFKEINEAYETLKDPKLRAIYDQERSPRPRNDYWANRPSFTDVDDILRGVHRARGYNNVSNRDINITYNITFEEAFSGKNAEIRYTIAGKIYDLNVKIPAGIQDGVKLRFKGNGDNSIPNCPPGDLFVKVVIMSHYSFTRQEFNLTTKLHIGYLEALVGTEKVIATIDGGHIKMKIPAGVTQGQSFRASGKGMTKTDGSRGDMIVEINLVPDLLSDDEKLQIQQIVLKRNG